jgi:hypothetical protein
MKQSAGPDKLFITCGHDELTIIGVWITDKNFY